MINSNILGLRRNSYTQYLIALAIVDTGAILSEGMLNVHAYELLNRLFVVLSALDELHQVEYKITLIQHTKLSCKLFNYIRYIFYSMSSW